MSQPTEKGQHWTLVLALAVIGVMSAALAALFPYLGMRAQVEVPIQATQTAEVKVIQATQTVEARNTAATQTVETRNIQATQGVETRAFQATQAADATVRAGSNQPAPLPDVSHAPEWQYWHDLALAALVAKDYPAVQESLRHAIDLEPKNTRWITLIGEQLHGKSHFAEAEAIFRMVRYRNDADVLALFWLAWSLFEQKHYSDAEAHFRQCIMTPTLISSHARCHGGLGLALKGQGLYAQARVELDLALTQDPTQTDARQALNSLP